MMNRGRERGQFGNRKYEVRPYFKGSRFKKPVEKKAEFNINCENFPDISNEVKEERVEREVKDFKNLDFTEKKIIEQEKKIKKGWLLLNRENLELYKSEKIRERENEENFVGRNVYDKMVNNWKNYRREINDILGDRSPYINTEREIEEMIKEDLRIDKEIAEYNEDKKMGRLEVGEEMDVEDIYN
jgi:hypothetical protein